MSNESNPKQDDGTLAFLNIPQDENNKHFNCRETTQQKLINLSFFVENFIDGVKTKFGAERFLVKIKHPDDSPDKPGQEEKFFTNSTEIKYVLREIKKRNAFPRKVHGRQGLPAAPGPARHPDEEQRRQRFYPWK